MDKIIALYNQYKEARYEVDQIKKRQNEHSDAYKNVDLFNSEEKRKQMHDRYQKIGRSYKKCLLEYESKLEKIEKELIV